MCITLIQPTAVDTLFPQHARNYQSEEAKLPSPMTQPRQVADAILNAAANPTRSKKVGMMVTVNTVLAKLTPRIAESLSAKQVEGQHGDMPAIDPQGTLFQPSEKVLGAGSTREVGAK